MNYGIALEMREAALSSVKWAIQSRLVGRELPAWIDTAQGLLLSRPVFWSSECAGAVAAAAPSFDLSEITCERHLLFTDCAFVWFEHPFMTMLSGGEEVPVVALQWQCEQHETTGRPQITMVNYAGTRKGPLPLMWSTTTFGDAMTPALGGEAGLQVTEEFASEQVAWKKWRQRLHPSAPVGGRSGQGRAIIPPPASG